MYELSYVPSGLKFLYIHPPAPPHLDWITMYIHPLTNYLAPFTQSLSACTFKSGTYWRKLLA